MAGCAGGRTRREIGRYIVGDVATKCLRAVPRRLVTAQTICRISTEIIIDVAGSAGSRGGRHVRANEAESGNAMVKQSGVPPGRGMAVRTIRCRKRCPELE